MVRLGGGDILAPVDTAASDGDVWTCEPGEHVCTSEMSWGVCTPGGTSVGVTHTCASTARCDPDVGVCLPLLCEPGALACADWQTVEICNALGTKHDGQGLCPDSGVCEDGVCRPCWAGQPACQSLHSVGMCKADGTGIVDGSLTMCPADQVCWGAQGEGIVPVCQPDSWRCLNPFVYQACNETGSQWKSSETCPEDFVCKDGGCVYAPCVPTVLFLVDRSGSMADRWAAVYASVSALVADNPDAIFGLMDFPTAFGSTACGTDSGMQIGFSFAETALFDAYFVATSPEGATPLVDAVETISYHAQNIFGVYRGNLVVLSDGADTCTDSEVLTRLEAAVTQLSVVHGVSTYVIGYAYEGDASQLDVMAAAGSTSFTTHVVAGDEASLVDAFNGVVDDIKICIE